MEVRDVMPICLFGFLKDGLGSVAMMDGVFVYSTDGITTLT